VLWFDAVKRRERPCGVRVDGHRARAPVGGSAILHAALAGSIAVLCAAADPDSRNSALAYQQATPKLDIFFSPTRYAVADAMLRLARVSPNDIVYDLGSGDGRIVILAAQKYGARGVGVELDARLVDISRQIARESEVVDRVTFVHGNLFTADISSATVVTLYLSASVNRDLEPKLKQELRPGTRIVSHQFPIGNWTPAATVHADDDTDLYLWIIPAK